MGSICIYAWTVRRAVRAHPIAAPVFPANLKKFLHSVAYPSRALSQSNERKLFTSPIISIIKTLLAIVLLLCESSYVMALRTQSSEQRPVRPTVLHESPETGRLHFQHVTADQGLSYPDVNRICQDSVGFMWFGSLSGLNRFDGREVKSIDIQDVDALCTDKEGNIWVGGTYALHCINTSRDTIISYNLEGVRAVVVDEDSTLWIGTDKGLFHLDPRIGWIMRIGRDAMADSGVTSIAMDKRGNLWLATRSSILYFNKASLTSRFITSRHGENPSSIAIGPDGKVWITGGTYNNLYYLDPGTLVPKDILENGHPVLASAVTVGPSGTVYIGTWDRGLKIYDPATRNWQTYLHSESDPQGLSNDMVNCVFLDRTGNLWIERRLG